LHFHPFAADAASIVLLPESWQVASCFCYYDMGRLSWASIFTWAAWHELLWEMGRKINWVEQRIGRKLLVAASIFPFSAMLCTPSVCRRRRGEFQWQKRGTAQQFVPDARRYSMNWWWRATLGGRWPTPGCLSVHVLRSTAWTSAAIVSDRSTSQQDSDRGPAACL
jgi:hypothetical protein